MMAKERSWVLRIERRIVLGMLMAGWCGGEEGVEWQLFSIWVICLADTYFKWKYVQLFVAMRC